MSRIGKKPIPLPANVKASVAGGVVTIENGGKKLTMTHKPVVSVAVDEGAKSVVVTIPEDRMGDREARALWGTTRALVNNMIRGVTSGFEKTLEINGVGWGATVAGTKLNLKVGYANQIPVEIPQGLEVKVDNNRVVIKGPDKQVVGQFAAVVRSKRTPEPYNGKGIKYIDEVIKRKQGKAFGA